MGRPQTGQWGTSSGGTLMAGRGARRRHELAPLADHKALCLNHSPDQALVVIGTPVARNAALQQAVVALCVEEASAVEPSQLELVVHVSREHEVVLAAHEGEQVVVGGARRPHVAVAPDVAAPVRPVLLKGVERVEAAGVHVREVVLLYEVAEGRLEARAGVGEASRGGEPSARANDDGVGLVEGALQTLALRVGGPPARRPYQASQVKHVRSLRP